MAVAAVSGVVAARAVALPAVAVVAVAALAVVARGVDQRGRLVVASSAKSIVSWS